MINRGSYQPVSESSNQPDYARIFVTRVHQLILWGYERLSPSEFKTSDEEDITGELAKCINLVFDDPDSPNPNISHS